MKIYKYGDNVDTDVIIPARYLNAPDEKSLASHCMEDIDADFAATVEPGDIVVGGSNFGCGSSREHAPLAIKACGVKCVIAKSFARIFYRNAINIGLPVLVSPELSDAVKEGDEASLDLTAGTVTVGEKTFTCTKLPPYMQRILNAGGLIAFLNEDAE